jgi:site-specific DNA-methyltransferase (adenine-specific)
MGNTINPDHAAAPRNVVLRGDCVEVMKTLPADSIDAIVTDPPYGIDFMGKEWDGFGTPLGFQTWTEQWAQEAFRVLKPGGHLLAFGGTRMYHRLASGVEGAGFEVRDMMSWLYGSGFPKSHNLKGEWEGWGTALKPAQEPIVVARKPLIGTVAENVLAHGTGAINIGASRIGTDDTRGKASATALGVINDDGWKPKPVIAGSAFGRWPANILFDEGAAAELDAQAPEVSRFFYVAKPSKKERNAGLEEMPDGWLGDGASASPTSNRKCLLCNKVKFAADHCVCEEPQWGEAGRQANTHPTVKPITLMGYLIKMVTPPGGVVLDPFLGSGSTACAAAANGFDWLGIERDEGYAHIAEARVQHWSDKRSDKPLTEDKG